MIFVELIRLLIQKSAVAVLLLTLLFPGQFEAPPTPVITPSPTPVVTPSPTPTPTPTPTPEPTPTPTPTPKPTPYGPPDAADVMGLLRGIRVPDEFFDDTLFAGDSVSRKLELYVRQRRKDEPRLLGNAGFYTAASMGSGNLQRTVTQKSIHAKVDGVKMTLEDAVAAYGSKKLYLMLGMNDIAVYGIQGSVDNLMTLIGKVREKSPDVEIFVQSVTPRVRGKDQKTLNNRNIVSYNQLLCQTIENCGLENIWFVDVASALRGEDGTLPREYCSDPGVQGIHFTDRACKIWVDYLYNHTPEG